MSQYFIHNRTQQMFKQRHFTLSSTKWAHLKSDAGLKKLAQGLRKAETARHFVKIQLGEHLATN